jgi:hypothetical protein
MTVHFGILLVLVTADGSIQAGHGLFDPVKGESILGRRHSELRGRNALRFAVWRIFGQSCMQLQSIFPGAEKSVRRVAELHPISRQYPVVE